MPGGTLTSADNVAHPFVVLRGQSQPLLPTLEEVTRSGADGHAYRVEPKRAEPFVLVGIVDVDDATALATKRDALLALQGTLIRHTDPFGVETPQVACLRARVLAQRKLIKASGGLSTQKGCLLVMEFVLQRTAP